MIKWNFHWKKLRVFITRCVLHWSRTFYSINKILSRFCIDFAWINFIDYFIYLFLIRCGMNRFGTEKTVMIPVRFFNESVPWRTRFNNNESLAESIRFRLCSMTNEYSFAIEHIQWQINFFAFRKQFSCFRIIVESKSFNYS